MPESSRAIPIKRWVEFWVVEVFVGGWNGGTEPKVLHRATTYPAAERFCDEYDGTSALEIRKVWVRE